MGFDLKNTNQSSAQARGASRTASENLPQQGVDRAQPLTQVAARLARETVNQANAQLVPQTQLTVGRHIQRIVLPGAEHVYPANSLIPPLSAYYTSHEEPDSGVFYAVLIEDVELVPDNEITAEVTRVADLTESNVVDAVNVVPLDAPLPRSDSPKQGPGF